MFDKILPDLPLHEKRRYDNLLGSIILRNFIIIKLVIKNKRHYFNS